MKPIALVLLATLLGCSPALAPIDLGTPYVPPVASVPSASSPSTPSIQNTAAQYPCASSQDIKLQLVAEQSPPFGPVRLGLHNVGTVPACVYTHVATHEWQHDWLEIEITDGKKTRSILFNDNRDKSATVIATIGPGQTDWQEVDVAAWARRQRNGGVAIAKGDFSALAIYDSSGEQNAWAGKLETPFRFRSR